MVLLTAGPFLLLRKKARAGFWQKLGFVPAAITGNNSLKGAVWFHAVSVGEFNAILPLIKSFHERFPHLPLVVSTTTYTGQSLAQEKVSKFAQVVYFPYDLPWAEAWLKALKPIMVVIAETEIWPGFAHLCRRLDVKLLVVNGRMSPRSFRSYHRYRFFFGPVLRCFDEIGVQSGEEADRYLSCGAARVRVLGNLKLDISPVAAERAESLRKELNLTDEFVLVGGSTHEGEEAALLKAYGALLDGRPAKDARLILVPRHPERFDHVAALVDQAGFVVRRYSRGERFEGKGREVYLLDVIGKLFDFYSIASLAFVGGTIAPVGGHNLMEPYVYAVPVVCGPHIEKTRDTARALVDCRALALEKDADAVVASLVRLAQSEDERRAAGAAGHNLLKASQGALGKALDMLAEHLQDVSAPESKLTASRR